MTSIIYRTAEFARDIYFAICKDSDDKPTDDGAEWLLNIIKTSEQDQLVLRTCRVGPSAAIQLGKRLDTNDERKLLSMLDLYDNAIKDVGCIALLKLVDRKPELRFFNIGCNDLGLESALAIAESLRQNQLEGLELGNPSGYLFNQINRKKSIHLNNFDGQAVVAIVQAMTQHQTLQYLGLSGCHTGIGDGGAFAISEMLQRNQVLRALDLGDNKLGNQGATMIFRGLSNNFTLQMLNLSDNGLSYIGIPLLAKILENENCRLEDINLSNNLIGPEGAKSLAFGLAQSRSIHKLKLDNCGLGDQGVSIICAVLAQPLISNQSQFNQVLKDAMNQEAYDPQDQIFEQMQDLFQKTEDLKSNLKQVVVVDNDGKVISQTYLKEQKQDPMEFERLKRSGSPQQIEMVSSLSRSRYVVVQSPEQELSDLELSAGYMSPDLMKQSVQQPGQQEKEEIDEFTYSQIERLSIGGNGIGLSGMRFVCQLICSPVNLKYLNLSNNKLNGQGIIMLSAALINGQYDLNKVLDFPDRKHIIENKQALKSNLQVLNLSKTQMNDDGFICLAFAVAQLGQIIYLNVSDNYISETGGLVGVRFNKENKQVLGFVLQGNQVSHVVLNQIDVIVKGNKKRVNQSAPRRLKQIIANLSVDAVKLPSATEDLKFLKESLVLCKQYVDQIVSQDKELQQTFKNQISSINLRQKGTREETLNNVKSIKEMTELMESNDAKQKLAKGEQNSQIEKATKQMQEMDAKLKSTMEQIEQFQTKKREICVDIARQIEEEQDAIQAAADVKASAKKYIQMMNVKHSDLIERACKSQAVGKILYTSTYPQLLPVVPRMQNVANGATSIPNQIGYEPDKVEVTPRAKSVRTSRKKK